jgi:site-specific DNA-cytosine methylase
MTDDETWVDGDHANTLNRFDVGDTRTTHIVVEAHGVSKDDDAVAGTLCTNAQGGQRTTDIAGAYVTEQMSVRRLTPVECERLMGLPDGWTAPDGVKAPDSKRYAACGDAIVTTVAFWIADRIRMIEEEEAS